jgi:hypothetical protein
MIYMYMYVYAILNITSHYRETLPIFGHHDEPYDANHCVCDFVCVSAAFWNVCSCVRARECWRAGDRAYTSVRIRRVARKRVRIHSPLCVRPRVLVFARARVLLCVGAKWGGREEGGGCVCVCVCEEKELRTYKSTYTHMSIHTEGV